MSKKLEVKITEYPEDLYSGIPSRYKASLTDTGTWSRESYIEGFGATPEEAVNYFISEYRDHLKTEEEQERWVQVSRSGTIFETREVEL